MPPKEAFHVFSSLTSLNVEKISHKFREIYKKAHYDFYPLYTVSKGVPLEIYSKELSLSLMKT